MPMLAEVIDAVVGVDTHRDTHALEIAAPTGATIAVTTSTTTRTASPPPSPGSAATHRARVSRSAWKAPVAMALGWPEPCKPRASPWSSGTPSPR